MKKLLLFAISCIILTACSNHSNKVVTNNDSIVADSMVVDSTVVQDSIK